MSSHLECVHGQHDAAREQHVALELRVERVRVIVTL